MAIGVRAFSAGSAGSITKPTGTVDGDVLVAFSVCDPDGTAATLTAPAGWTQTGGDGSSGTSIRGRIWSRAASGEGASYTFGASGSTDCAVKIVNFTGVDTTTPILVAASWAYSSGSNASVVAPSVSPGSAGTLVCLFGSQNAGTFSQPAGMTEIADSAPAGWAASAVDRQDVTSGATGTRTSTHSVSELWIAASLVLNPASTGVTGTLTGTAPAAQASLSATTTATGALAATTPPATAATAGTVTATGSLTAVAPAPVAALTDVPFATGPLTGAAPVPAAALTGTLTATGLLGATAGLPVISLTTPEPIPSSLVLSPQLGIPVSSGQVRRASARWRVMIADTRSGQLLGELPYQDLAWTDSLDFTRTSSLSVTVPLETAEDVARVRSVARGAWRYTLVAAYDGVPIVAGPPLTHKVDDDGTSAELGCGGPASLLAARLVVRLNWMPNPSFETGVDDWTAIGPVGSTTAQITQSVPPTDVAPPDGESWLRVTSGGTTGTIAVASPRIPITPGLPYTVSVYVRNSAPSQVTEGFILWYDSLTGDPWEWDSYTFQPWGDTFGTWVRKRVTAVAPANAVALGLQVQAPAASVGHYLDLDAVLVELSTDMNSYNVAQGEVKVGPLSLPEIARLMVLLATLRMGSAEGAELPIDLPDDIVVDGPHVRTYQMHELGTIAERLGQLTQVEGGPDVHLRPVLTADGRSMRWEVRIGQPRLGSPAGWVWTYGANCAQIAVDSDAAAMTMRAFVPGQSGTDTGTPVGDAEDLTLIDAGWPLLERGDSARSTTETTVNLEAQAADYLRAHDRPVEAWQVTVRADRHPVLGTWLLGDDALLRIRGHRWIEDADYPRRILSVSGDASDEITLGVTSGEGQV